MSNDVNTALTLEKKRDKIEKFNLSELEKKMDEEIQSTKKLLDSHSNQLKQQKAQFLEFSAVESKLNDIEFRLSLEMAKAENFTNYLHSKNFENFAKSDQPTQILNVTTTKAPTINFDFEKEFNETFAKLSADFQDRLETQQNLTINLTEDFENLKYSFDEFEERIVNFTDETRENFESFENSTIIQAEILQNLTENFDELSDLADVNQEEISNLTWKIDLLELDIQNLTRRIEILEIKQLEDDQKSLIIESLSETVAALKYGYDIPPEIDEILITGGDGEYGAIWDSMLISTTHKAKRDFKDRFENSVSEM